MGDIDLPLQFAGRIADHAEIPKGDDKYEILATIYQGIHTTVYRGRRLSDGFAVLLKTTSRELPGPDEIAKLKYDYFMVKAMALEGTPKPLELISIQSKLYVAFEDEGYESLSELIKAGGLSFKGKLQIALGVAQVLTKIHDHYVIHRDIKPGNIIVDPKSFRVKIIDFGVSLKISSKQQEVNLRNAVQGTLFYMSPEQTGRMNCSIDCRSDLYSLGVTCYELFTGRLPCDDRDPLTVIHHHIAIYPPPPLEVQPSLPPLLSELIMKLIAKNADERYQSAAGLSYDLEWIQKNYGDSQRLADFSLRSRDQSRNFYLKEKLYGREREIEIMLNGFDLAKQGHKVLLLATGYAGVGKTSLIGEVAKPCAANHSYFIRGKFERYLKDIPYRALGVAFYTAVQQILTQNRAVVSEWREKILRAVGNNGRLLTDLIPDLQLLIGQQPEVPALDSEKMEMRFSTVLIDFIALFSSPDRPLVFFLDDLQWASIAAIKLLQKLLKSHQLSRCMFIFSFRANEISAGHPLAEQLQESQASNAFAFFSIDLQPLSPGDVKEMLSDSFPCAPTQGEALTQICYEKTGGNPFFLKQFLNELYDNNLITYDIESAHWNFDIDAIGRLQVSGDVIEFLLEKFQTLPPLHSMVLQTAACIGSEFDSVVLIDIMQEDPAQIIDAISNLKSLGLLVVIDGSLEFAAVDRALNVRLKVSHDNIQQSAYQLLGLEERQKIHFREAHRLLALGLERCSPMEIFTTATHFNRAGERVQSRSDIFAAYQWNSAASHLARKTANNEAALNYSQQAVAYLERQGESSMENVDYFAAYKDLAECYYINGEYEASENCFQKLLSEATDNSVRAEIYLSRSHLYNVMRKYDFVIRDGLKVFSLFRYRVAEYPTSFSLMFQYVKVRGLLLLPGRKQRLLNCQCTSHIKLFNEYYQVMLGALLLKNPKLLLVLSMRALEVSINHGYAVGTMSALLFTSTIATELGQYKFAKKLVGWASDLSKKMKHDIGVNFVYNLGFKFWHLHLSKGEQICYNFLLASREEGDREYTINSLLQMINCMNLSGTPLREVKEKIEGYYPVALEINDHDVNASLRYIYQNTLLLMEDAESEVNSSLEITAEDVEAYTKGGMGKLKFNYSINKIFSAYLLEDYDEAYRHGLILEELYINNIARGLYFWVGAFYLSPLSAIAKLRQLENSDGRASILRQLKVWFKRLKRQAAIYPVNLKSKWKLVLAEKFSLEGGDKKKAFQLYEEAIEAAKEYGCPHEYALSHELTAYFLMREGHETSSYGHLQKAFVLYEQWGGRAVNNKLLGRFPDLFSISAPNMELDDLLASKCTTSTTSTTFRFDLEAILKCSQSIAMELRPEVLTQNILKVIAQISGAEKVVLLLYKDLKLVVSGKLVDREQSEELKVEEIDYRQVDYFPIQLIDFVTHKGEYFLDGDLSINELFRADPYVKKNQPSSALCYPVMKAKRIIGILYLENNFAKNAFSSKHLAAIDILGGEIATMLETAQSFRSFERFVPKEFLTALGKEKITSVALGDHRQLMLPILFADIRDFTSVSERLTPQEIFELLNRFLSIVVPIISKHKGFIDKYIGDVIMALFNGSADEALAGAIKVHAVVEELQAEIVGGHDITLKMGIGMNVGPAVLGVLGSQERMDTTVISDAVNISSRLQGLTKVYGVTTLISDTFFHALDHPERYHIDFIDKVMLRGKSVKMNVYAVSQLGSDEENALHRKYQHAYEEAWKEYEQGDLDRARRHFLALKNKNGVDKKVDYFLDQCAEFPQVVG